MADPRWLTSAYLHGVPIFQTQNTPMPGVESESRPDSTPLVAPYPHPNQIGAPQPIAFAPIYPPSPPHATIGSQYGRALTTSYPQAPFLQWPGQAIYPRAPPPLPPALSQLPAPIPSITPVPSFSPPVLSVNYPYTNLESSIPGQNFPYGQLPAGQTKESSGQQNNIQAAREPVPHHAHGPNQSSAESVPVNTTHRSQNQVSPRQDKKRDHGSPREEVPQQVDRNKTLDSEDLDSPCYVPESPQPTKPVPSRHPPIISLSRKAPVESATKRIPVTDQKAVLARGTRQLLYKQPDDDPDIVTPVSSSAALRSNQRRVESKETHRPPSLPPSDGGGRDSASTVRLQRMVILSSHDDEGEPQRIEYSEEEYQATQASRLPGRQLGKHRRDKEYQQSSICLFRHLDENHNEEYRSVNIIAPPFLELLRKVGPYNMHPERGSRDSAASVFSEPFIDLFYRRDGLREHYNTIDRALHGQNPAMEEKYMCLEILLELLEKEFHHTSEQFDLYRSPRAPATINFANLWMIYQPGSLVFRQAEGKPPIALMVDSVQLPSPMFEIRSHLTLHCWFIDYRMVEGQYLGKFGRRGRIENVNKFDGDQLISKLKLVPDSFFKDTEIRNQILRSGRKFWELSGPSLRQVAVRDSMGYDKLDYERIIIDPTEPPDDDRQKFGPLPPGARPSGYIPPSRQVDMSISRSWFTEYDAISPSSEPDDLMLLLCPPVVRGFSLRKKVWSSYGVAQLEPVKFQENAWSRLVIEEEYKDVVQAMVNSHLRQSNGLEDIIQGKGGGVVLLLHGPPGVGKTLTAESVAESVQRPLYMVTAGDLGTNPENLELKLSKIFKLATRWNAILLLDEADVFLQDRDFENLTRNALVSIFLQALEYFKGVLFLTSNRVGTFDPAFQSRIHITLGIPEFDESVRTEVWNIFLADLGLKGQDGSEPLLTREECKALKREVLHSWAREPLNGRQIRNCVRSALALAQDKGEKVSAKHFNTVIRLGNTFTKYMHRLHKFGVDEVAQVKGDRLAEMRSLVSTIKERSIDQVADGPGSH